MGWMKSLFLREYQLANRVGGGALIGVLFFLAVVTIFPFGVGPDMILLSRIGAAILWIGALLATLLGLDRLFQADREDGTLELLIMSGRPLELVVLIKCAAHWAATGLPLVLATPILSLFVGLDFQSILMVTLTLLVGAPALTLLGAVGAGVTVSMRRGGVLLSILVIPLAIPILIFGVSAATADTISSNNFIAPFLFLCALTLFGLVIGPLAAAAALRISGD
ncbi:Heme exporter protein B [Pseudovibrio axinellae]|uniref:Heme exporter protein B n=1 Tax=Pseudovibrio axinellae TaxID=989403 RepID=A0A161V9S4_9HYPH|nr:heme exporter protein CcmB [Pseudovibrio axinellae]KZL21770.1 Heme exporter protein B [Pseudovibrio axinellae]SEQ22623.1 heme exporter protein B [Pseudovibrio axinellae]